MSIALEKLLSSVCFHCFGGNFENSPLLCMQTSMPPCLCFRTYLFRTSFLHLIFCTQKKKVQGRDGENRLVRVNGTRRIFFSPYFTCIFIKYSVQVYVFHTALQFYCYNKLFAQFIIDLVTFFVYFFQQNIVNDLSC